MAETNISADKNTGGVIEADDVNELKSALVTTLSPRNAAGTLTKSQNLGSALFPWGILFADSLIINGQFIDVSLIASEANIVKSGQIRSTSNQVDFIRVDGATNEATIEAATTDLVYIVNGITVNLEDDILLTTLTVAASGATEECLINDAGLTDQEESKFLGGEDDTIPVDTMGASISAKVGQVVCLQKGSELMLAFVKSTTELTNVKRGYFFDSSGDPIVRETLANNDTLTLMSLGYVFLEDDASTTEVSFLNPVYSFDTPISPAAGQYWFDLTNKQWKRFDSSVFVVINRILIGLVVIDTANAIGSRSLDFDLDYSDLNSLSYEEFSDTTITSKDIDNSISINANELNTRENRIIFDITTDRATGVSETASTRYYAYISQDGQRRIDTERPYELNPFLRGYYHPYQSWRCIASFNNDSGSDIDSVIDIADLIEGFSDDEGIGTITACAFETPSAGSLECDGAAVSRLVFSRLFNKIGVRFGTGDGSTTFNIPDLRGEFIRGFDNGAGNDPDAGSRTDSGDGTSGDNVGTKQLDQFDSHTHTVVGDGTSSAGSGFAGEIGQDTDGSSFTTNARGGSETRPRNIYMMYCIKF